MKIPKHIVTKLIKIDKNYKQSMHLSREIDEWLTENGIDIYKLRSETSSVLESAEHGELLSLDYEEIALLLLKNIEDLKQN
jgi:hypothetical protein